MNFSKNDHLIVATVARGVWVVRFTHPDLREQLYDDAEIDGCMLFQELHECVLSRLKADETLVLNLGLIEPLPSVFLRFLLTVRSIVKANRGRLVLCRLSKEHHEIFHVTRTLQLFHITDTEAQARKATEITEDTEKEEQRENSCQHTI